MASLLQGVPDPKSRAEAAQRARPIGILMTSAPAHAAIGDDIVYPSIVPFLAVHLGCLAAIWTGTLASARFVELPFIAVNPRESARLVWPTFQTYADGEKVEWTGPEGSKSPASVTPSIGGPRSLPLGS